MTGRELNGDVEEWYPYRDFPGGPVVKTSPQRVQVQSLVEELRFHMPHGQKTKPRKKTEAIL